MTSPTLLPSKLRHALERVRSVGVITGAGISAESGIPTYRGQGGLYDDPEEGDRTVEALSGSTLLCDPDRTWKVVAELARKAAHAEPNPGHFAITEIEGRVAEFTLLTQNVDGLHREAGTREIIDIHGDIFRATCMVCDRKGQLGRGELRELESTPRCEACGGSLRPRVVLFGEMLPTDKLARMQDRLLRSMPDLMLAVGTTAAFPYIYQPVLIAAAAGKLTIEVNPEATDLSPIVDFHLRGPAGVYLPLLAAAIPAAG